MKEDSVVSRQSHSHIEMIKLLSNGLGAAAGPQALYARKERWVLKAFGYLFAANSLPGKRENLNARVAAASRILAIPLHAPSNSVRGGAETHTAVRSASKKRNHSE